MTIDPSNIGVIVWAVAVVVLIVAVVVTKRKRRAGTLTGAVAGTLHDWQSRDKQRALEIIVEDKAEARDPEDKEGDLPKLEKP